VDEDALHRVMRALASDGVFAEHEGRVFVNTAASEVAGTETWTSTAHMFAGVYYRAVEDLAEAVRKGAATFERRFGAEYWPWLASHPEERSEFDRSMGGSDSAAERLAGLAWRDGEVVVDVGGGNGSLLLGLLRRKPSLRGIVFDLPETNRDESSFPDRLEFVEGDFFERAPRGDAYLLSGILHDWDDERATAILRTVRAAAGDDGRLLIIDSVLPEGNDPDGAKWLDLLMLALLGGKERSEEQWRALLEAGGFDSVRFHEVVIEARPA
jgi:hypothetical protein